MRCLASLARPMRRRIKKAFRQLARELHPDVNTEDPDAAERFKEAAEAYEILSDPERRATYDRFGHEGLRSGGYQPNFDQFGSISDLFEAFFGAGGGASSAAVDGEPRSEATSRLSCTSSSRRRRTADRSRSPTTRSIACGNCNGNGAEPGTPIRGLLTLRRLRAAAERREDPLRSGHAKRGVRRLRRRRAHRQATLPRVSGARTQGREPDDPGRHPGGHCRRTACARQRSRPRWRVRSAAR